jgi:hypothetical protein
MNEYYHSVKIECPYCGFMNREALKLNDWTAHVIYCDQEAGGCDGEFVYKPYNWQINVSIHTSTLPWASSEPFDDKWFDNNSEDPGEAKGPGGG